MTYEIQRTFDSERQNPHIAVAATKEGYESILLKSFGDVVFRITSAGYRILMKQRNGDFVAPYTATQDAQHVRTPACIKNAIEFFAKRDVTPEEAEYIDSLPQSSGVARGRIYRRSYGDPIRNPTWLDAGVAAARDAGALRGY